LFFVRENGELEELTQENWYKGFTASAGKEEKGELRSYPSTSPTTPRR
jgi:hypothetical protein